MTDALPPQVRAQRDMAMSDLLNEQLSALVDGELPPEETALLLRRIEREPELARRLARYRACGEVLRGEQYPLRGDFALRVSAAIALEPAPSAAGLRPASVQRRQVPGWLRSAAGLAVAASVGMIAVLVLQRAVPSALPTAGQVAQVRALEVAPAPMQLATTLPQVPAGVEPRSYVTPPGRAGLQEIQGATLANYVVAHSSVSGPLAGRSVLIHLLADQPAAESGGR